MRRTILLSGLMALIAACAPAANEAETSSHAAQDDPLRITPLTSALLDPTAPVTRIAFGSCNQQWADQSIFGTIAGVEPDLFLFIGDNMYADNYVQDIYADLTLPNGGVLSSYKVDRARQAGPKYIAKAYRELAASEPFARLRKEVPLIAIWDDHDYGLNDAGAAMPFKAAAQELFLKAYDIPQEDPRWSREGIYGSYMLGPQGRRLHIILLDTRSFRSALKSTDEPMAEGKERYVPDPDPAKTMLGEAQWAWLEEELRKPADLKVLVSSIQIVADGHGWEAWRTLPLERERLFDLIEKTGAERVFAVTGDRHVGGLYREKAATPYPFYELTSSSLNAPARNNTAEAGPKRLGDIYNVENFGVIDIDWDASAIALELRDKEGGVLLGQFVPFADLETDS